ncbi:uncharacterized protein LOC132748317 [Ruditapes philippinarum]|uniref:uncharacterized protein LOC132748317 n=1 Tax=Ruditapes philippinarum TaxID=129788 RepID=UPI00295B24FC|nr:uncharacterized protein LOC132748317 [Ruditapes philippinarum]
MDDAIYMVLLIALVGYSEALECYSNFCSNVVDKVKCNITTSTLSCSAGQSCYKNLTTGQQSLGCIDNQNCDSHAAVSTIVGRDLVSRETSSCFECCSTDRCNSALCLHPGRKSDAVYVLNMFLFIH